MKKGLLGGIGLAVVIIAGLICVAKCSVRVPAGYIAVEYKMNGGISKNVLTQGWHLISPTVKTSLYSVGIEQSYLTSEDKGDSPKDESFKTPTADGKSLQVDLEFSYKFDQSRVTDVFTQFKGQSGESVKNTFIKPKMKAWTQEVTAIVNKLTLQINNFSSNYTDYIWDGARVVCHIGLELSTGIEKIRICTMTVTDAPYQNTAIISLTCEDSMRLFDRDYSDSKLTYPATRLQIIQDACEVCGVTLQSTRFKS